MQGSRRASLLTVRFALQFDSGRVKKVIAIDDLVRMANEAQTRALQIDPQLRAADWKLKDRTQVRLEVPVDGYDAEPWNGVTDYCLYDPGGQVLAVVEAKRTSRHARDADVQLRHYVTEIARRQSFAPFGFMTNGYATHFWEVGL